MRTLKGILRTVNRLDWMLTANSEDPISLHVYKQPPASKPDLPGLTPGKFNRPLIWEIEETKSAVLTEAVHSLLETYYKAEEIEAKMAARRKKYLDLLKKKYEPQLAETKGKLPERSDEVWRIVEKNKGVIQEGEKQLIRIASLVAQLKGHMREEAPEPSPLPEDPRVEAAIQWVAKKMPALLKEFMSVLDQAEKEFLEAEKSEPSLTPRELNIVNPSETASLHISANLVEWLSSLWGKLKNSVQALTHGADYLEELVSP
jgi:uncharacterized protein (UPF0305 family)